MKLTIRYFASLREALGPTQVLDDVPAGLSVAQLRDRLKGSSPVHAEALASTRAVRCAVNQTLCAETVILEDDAELAFFPPVTGG
mgnify:CR=1 FL=1